MSCCGGNKPNQGQEKSGFKSLISGPRRLWILGAVIVAGGLAMGWDQLVILGMAPILLALLPCLLMCGVMCLTKCKKDKKDESASQSETAAQQAHADMSPTTTKKTF
jgi:type III secretory pathway component EscV|tara:strand:+ start:158 stop:478 length:321 start_codon:yes stop_codon:yes gene_type:complete